MHRYKKYRLSLSLSLSLTHTHTPINYHSHISPLLLTKTLSPTHILSFSNYIHTLSPPIIYSLSLSHTHIHSLSLKNTLFYFTHNLSLSHTYTLSLKPLLTLHILSHTIFTQAITYSLISNLPSLFLSHTPSHTHTPTHSNSFSIDQVCSHIVCTYKSKNPYSYPITRLHSLSIHLRNSFFLFLSLSYTKIIIAKVANDAMRVFLLSTTVVILTPFHSSNKSWNKCGARLKGSLFT